uniref:Cordon-bleu WH2 repeat protein n=1 Tax=Neogobius melanostomus TaxID=47308 RepID=A0A8C6UX38_9GOBI
MDASKPPLGTRMKPRAPPPPQVPQPAPRQILRNAESWDRAADRDAKENMLSTRVEVRLTLPSGVQTTVTEDGSTALMDVLVELCSRYHLNPSLHTLELFTPEGHPLGFKPNALLGSLNVARVLIKEKVQEERLVRRPAPRVPEKTVRLLVNYHGSQKAVVRVNPLLPLQDLVPVISDKCELDPALIVLLKDSINRQELPLDKSLTHLGIKELYVHDKSLDSIRSSTNSLARAEKKGLLGIFQFSRRKSKTETTSLDMDDYDDRNSPNTEAQSNAMSTMFATPYVDERPHTIGQSQSAINIARMSPKAETKKRRAPAPPGVPTPSIEHSGFETNQMGLGSESQQRKRKAPVPPPTPVSVDSGSDDTSAAVTPVSLHVQAPAPMSRTKVAAPITVSATTVTEAMKLVAPITLQAAECSTSLDLRSSTPSSTTSESLTVQDSSSELSQSLDDSDAAFNCSTSTSSTVSRPTQAQSVAKSSISRTEKSETTTNMTASDVSTAGSSRSDTESAINLKMEETENNRHSGVVWLHSGQSSATTGHSTEVSVEETVSLGSNSSGSSLPDQGYAASEGTADGEDSGLISSPSETQTTSPDGSLSLDGSTGGERRIGTAPDNFSDSDEGSWGSRHRSRDVTPHPKTDRLKHQDLSAQLHRTLADLESSLRDSDEVPVSVVDHDVPVTTIDEVLPDEGFWAESVATSASNYGDELQNRNNNAHTANETSKGSTEKKHLSQHKQKEKSEQGQSKTHKKDTCLVSKTKEFKNTEDSAQTKPSSSTSNGEEQKRNTNSAVKSDPEKINREDKPALMPVSQEAVDLHKVHHIISSSKPLQSKITPNVTSRFGMKTFTVVPPKPAMMQAAAGEPASASPCAIKIDEQGNMVKVSVSHHRATAVSHLGKAKAFWSSNEKQEGAVAPRKGLADKARDSLDCHKSAWTSETAQRSTDVGSLKTFQGTLNKSSQVEPKETAEDTTQQVKDTDSKQKDSTMAEDKISPSINTNLSSQWPAQPPVITDARRDLSFLKPSRRTSSQYVASAITKHAPRTTFKPDYNPTTPEFLLKTQNTGVQKSGKSITINPQNSFRSCNPPGPKGSLSYPEHTSSRQEERTVETKNELKELNVSEKNFGFGKTSFGEQGAQKSASEQSASSAQLTSKVRDTFKPVHRRSPSPSPSRPSYSYDKSSPGLKNGNQEQAVNNSITSLSSNPSKPEEKPSVTVTNCEPTPCPPAVTVFGPVKKFKPVICRSVEKEMNLHSSLMEAIQSGGGKDRLKKISNSAPNIKKPSYAEEENERSALMTAIRAQSTSGRLKKTKCEAAEELENFRRTASAVNGSAQVSSSSASTSSAPLQSSIPPPPLAFTLAPPPPPPVLPAPKSFTRPQRNMGANPAVAREAMLEAIRSGSAAEKLKKVAVPAKTVQVNGRMGTIKATSSTVS